MESLIMNDFQLAMNKKNEYCLKNIARHISIKYKNLFDDFKKKWITRDELNQLLMKYNSNVNVQIFEKKLHLFEKNPWIKNAALLIKEREYDNLKIDQVFIQLWTALDGKKDVLISNEILKFLGLLNKNYDNQIDFEKDFLELKNILSQNNINFTEHEHNAIRLSCSDFRKCTKKLNINNENHKIREYYSELETIHNFYKREQADRENEKLRIDKRNLSIQNEKQQEILRKEKEKNDKNNEIIKRQRSFIDNVKCKTKDGWIYVATSNSYAYENKFKVGMTENLRSRLTNFNTTRASNDEFWYCYVEKTYNMRQVESVIHDLLKDFRDINNREIFNMHHTFLIPIVRSLIENITKSYEDLNKIVKNRKVYEIRGTLPQKLDISDIEGLEDNELLNHINKVFDGYIKKNTSSISRKQFYFDLTNEMQSKFSKVAVMKILKNHFKWKKSSEPIMHQNHKICMSAR